MLGGDYAWQKKLRSSCRKHGRPWHRMGEQIRLARLRRKLSLELVAERAGISRATLISIEKGTPTVSIGSYAAVLHALNNMDGDLLLIAKDDEFGRKLQDLALPTRRRAPKKGE